jgi:hypothetical protein
LEKIKNREIIKQYSNIDTILKEQFFAIKDYDKYRLENNKKLKELYNLDTL